jgi:hypothetical protein
MSYHLRETRVGKRVEPSVELRPKMALGFHEGLAQLYDLGYTESRIQRGRLRMSSQTPN